MSLQTDIDVLKDIPGYKAILKSVLKTQIQLLIEQLAENTGEESIILTASINDGTLSHLGSNTGKGFLDGREEIKSQFLGYCLKSHHRRKSDVDSSLFQSRSLSGPQLASRRPRIRPGPYSMSPQGSSHPQFQASSSTSNSQQSTPYSQNSNVKSEQSAEGSSFMDNVSGGSQEDFGSGVATGVIGGGDGEAGSFDGMGMPLNQDKEGQDSSKVAEGAGEIQTKIEPGTEDSINVDETGVESSIPGDGWGQQPGYSGGDEDAGMSGLPGASGYTDSEQTYVDADGMMYMHGEEENNFPDLTPIVHTPARRGRPRKQPSPYVGNNGDASMAVTPKRGRGRGKKVPMTLPPGLVCPTGISLGNGYVKCNVCAKVLKATSMFSHKQVHLGIKKYTCEHCGKSFTQKGPLITHNRVHTGEKPYKCQGCGKLFAAQSGLYQHSRRCHEQARDGLDLNTDDLDLNNTV